MRGVRGLRPQPTLERRANWPVSCIGCYYLGGGQQRPYSSVSGSSRAKPTESAVSVHRMDDHGHSYHIKDFPSKEEAEKYLEELDRRNTTHVGQGHKQHYWIEWKPSPPRPRAV